MRLEVGGQRLEAKTSFIPESVSLIPLEIKKRIEPQSTPRTQSFFFRKAKNTDHFVDISSPLRSPGSLRFPVVFRFGESKSSFPFILLYLCVLCDLCG
jgi:hypothetical protein